MKCPKCGFTSFDYLDECKKCGVDISEVRGHLGIIAVSPDERAASSPSGMMVDDTEGGSAATAATAGLESATFLGDDLSENSFEDTFDSLMDEPDAAAVTDENQGIVLDSPLPGLEAPQVEADADDLDSMGGGDDEEFLDLDFGGIFEEEDK